MLSAAEVRRSVDRLGAALLPHELPAEGITAGGAEEASGSSDDSSDEDEGVNFSLDDLYSEPLLLLGCRG